MIGKMRAAQEIQRLAATNYFAALNETGVNELVRMLIFADSEIVGVAVINQWLEEQTERPTPADLRQLVTVHNEAAKARRTANERKPPQSEEEQEFLRWRKETHGW